MGALQGNVALVSGGRGGVGRAICARFEATPPTSPKPAPIHPIRRFGSPEDVANLANWLASAESRYASGQLWVLDGGLTTQVQQLRL